MLIIMGCAGAAAAVAVLAVSGRSDQRSAAAGAVLPRASCGSATTHRVDNLTTIIAADPGALSCFETAARSCGSASLRVVEMGVDAGYMHVFIIERSGIAERGGAPCLVTELSQGYSARFGESADQVSSLTCRMTAATGAGVGLRCGGRDVVIPAVVGGAAKSGA